MDIQLYTHTHTHPHKLKKLYYIGVGGMAQWVEAFSAKTDDDPSSIRRTHMVVK